MKPNLLPYVLIMGVILTIRLVEQGLGELKVAHPDGLITMPVFHWY